MSADKPKIPFESAVMPEVLGEGTEISFRCYKGISCFNTCCKNADVTLAPSDIIRLKRRLALSSEEFLEKHTVPFQMDGDGTPGVKIKTTKQGVCPLLDGDNGCSVYDDRPTVCRYYPVALLSIRPKGSPEASQSYSLVQESHCKGHDEDRRISIGDYRKEQGCVEFDELNREWYELVLKKKSAGPTVGMPPKASLQLFFMASYNLDAFRRFVLSENFLGTYQLPAEFYAEVEGDDEALLGFAYRFLRQTLFGEHTIQEAADAWEKRIEQRKEVWAARREMELQRKQAAEDEKYKHQPDCGAI